MKRTRFWILGALVVVSVLLAGANFSARKNSIFRLARYEKSPAFTEYISYLQIQTQKSPPKATSLVRPINLLLELAYPMSRDYESMLSCQMDVKGNFGYGRIHPARATRGYDAQQKLTSVQLANISHLMRALPPSSAPTDRYDVLSIVLYDSNPPQIRLYDRRHPPKKIMDICRILKMPLDLTRYG